MLRFAINFVLVLLFFAFLFFVVAAQIIRHEKQAKQSGTPNWLKSFSKTYLNDLPVALVILFAWLLGVLIVLAGTISRKPFAQPVDPYLRMEDDSKNENDLTNS